MVMSGITVHVASSRDLEAVVAVQHRAFERVAREYHIEAANLPPVRETLADLRRLRDQDTRFFVALDAGGTTIGAVRAHRLGEVIHVGRLVVDDEWVRRGVATMLMEALEAAYPAAAAFELFTGAEAVAPLTLYRKLGYRVTRRDESGPVPLVWLEKRTPLHPVG
jgi:GNAT superfamily N-acetyltransferase